MMDQFSNMGMGGWPPPLAKTDNLGAAGPWNYSFANPPPGWQMQGGRFQRIPQGQELPQGWGGFQPPPVQRPPGVTMGGFGGQPSPLDALHQRMRTFM